MTEPGKNFPGEKGFPTPQEIPEEQGYLLFLFPNSNDYAGVLLGAADSLSREYNWFKWGEMLPEDAADEWRQIINQAPYNLREPSVPAPYWEDGIEADDEAPKDDQHWYGYVSEGNFVEDAGIWLISNFLASALSENAAILYATNERKIRLSFLKGGLGGVVRIYVEEILTNVIDLNGDDGVVVNVDVLTGYVDTAKQVLQVLGSL